MRKTVILCTYNRAQSLQKALASAAAMSLPESDEWDFLAVDNNSNDGTREVIEEFCRRFPSRFRYVFEPRPGKSYALNTGIEQARGDVLAFMDDDVEVDPNWLRNLTAPLHDGKWAGVGGRILPEKGFLPQRWMDTSTPDGLAPLAILDRGSEARELSEAPYGTNMAFRKGMFEKYGGFREDLGPRPETDLKCEDAEFGSRLLAAGERFLYEPSAIVYHTIPPHRAQPHYFQTWWLRKGRSDIIQNGIPADTRWTIAGIPLYLFRRLVVWTLRWVACLRQPKRFSCKLRVWQLAGMIVECHSQARRRKTCCP
ncbi:MAG: glycosyltransferase [Terracidiphilus sp.]